MMNIKLLPIVLMLSASFVHFSEAYVVNNVSVMCKERERQALLSLKQGFVDPNDTLSSWGNGENQTECCEWKGVQCDTQTGHVVQLDLFLLSLEGKISPSLADLHDLEYLDLSFNYYFGNFTEFSKFIASLTHLQYLGLSSMNELCLEIPYNQDLMFLDRNELTGRIPHQLGNLSNLEELALFNNNLSGDIPIELGNLSNLTDLDLSMNELTGRIPHQLGNLSNLTFLRLLGNSFIGDLESVSLLGNLPLLRHLSLGSNQLEGGIPASLFDLCNLQFLDLSHNILSGHLEEYLPTSGHCAIKSLQDLYLSNNHITGSVPDLSQYSSLETLDLGYNQLNGSLSSGIGQLLSLDSLIVRHNSLKGVISETHFLRLFNVSKLDLSFNELIFNTSREWVPPFRLFFALLASCKLGPTFPIWLQTQTELLELDISSAGIYDTIPNWIWEMSSLDRLNLSHNQIRGQIPDLALQFLPHEIDLSSNLIEGPIRLNLTWTQLVDLSNNKLTNAFFALCPNNSSFLYYLDLSNNQLFGELPDCWERFQSLIFLSLANNSFHGKISPSMGLLPEIRSLHLQKNRFGGEIPVSLNRCTELITFDVSQNNLSGSIPSWIGELRNLIVLSLRSNLFFGSLPSGICQLSQVQILDLSSNKISGSIPSCLNNLTALATQTNSTATIAYTVTQTLTSPYSPEDLTYNYSLDDSTFLIWKGQESKYQSTLRLVRSIDLSSNMLMGEIPSELMDLVGIVSLNISRNMINGGIPATIGRLKSLDFLDLSRNHLSGRIPSELSQIDRLGVLDLSYNNLSGEIPLGIQLQSFDASTYEGNANLCGPPLSKCSTKPKDDDENHGKFEDSELFGRGFYISLAIGFSIGFWGVCSVLFLNKSWRYAYFKVLNDAYDEVYVVVAIKVGKLRRRMNRGSE